MKKEELYGIFNIEEREIKDMLHFLAMLFGSSQHSKLEDLYLKHGSSMYRAAFRILNDEHLAQDAVQEAFIRISKNLEKINDPNCNRTRAFVVIIVRNTSFDIYRLRKKQSCLPLEDMERLPEFGPSVEDIVIDNTMLEAMADRIRALPSHYADIIALKYFYHYDYEEIAKILEITALNARTRMHRAKQNLIKMISEEQEVANNE